MAGVMGDETKSLRLCREILRIWSKQNKVSYVPLVFRGSLKYRRWTVNYNGLYVYDPRPRIFMNRASWKFNATVPWWKRNIECLAHEFVHHLQFIRAGMNSEKAFPSIEFSKEHHKRKHEGEANQISEMMVDQILHRIRMGDISLLPRDGMFVELEGSPPPPVRTQGTVVEGWHSSLTGELGISDPYKSTEGVGYYIALDKETAEFFGRVVKPVSFTLFNPLDTYGEPPYILHEAEEVMEPPTPGDSVWLSAIKEAVSRSGTTNENWGHNQERLNQALTDVLQDRGYDGILIETWAVKFASPEERAGLEGYLKNERS